MGTRLKHTKAYLALALSLGFTPVLGACSSEAAAASEDAQTAVAADSAGELNYDPRKSLAPLVERVGPAVVSIKVVGTRKQPSFLGTQSIPTQSGGSGFIINADGLVVTNHHVVDGAQRVVVQTSDGREYEAEVLGTDPETDLAVIQLRDATGLPTVEFGSSKALKVGDWVVAIGSPMGLQHSASVGILSGRGRGSLGLYADSYLDFLQTDADIAQGSSGGPLFDLQGKVVGINTAVGTNSRPGFAIPAAQAQRVIPMLLEDGVVTRGWLGASGQAGAGDHDGAVIGRVFADTPAAEAGLEPGDVIVSVDGTRIEDFDRLRRVIANLQPGHAILIEVNRDGKTLEQTAVLSARPKAEQLRSMHSAPARARRFPIAPPSSEPSPAVPRGASGERLGVQAKTVERGLEVVVTEAGSLAEELGLTAGDVVVRINGEDVSQPQDVRGALARSRNRVEIEFLRDGTNHRTTVERS